MSAMIFDTLKLATKLEQSGFSSEQAKGAAIALAEAFADEMVTKTYFDARLEARLEATKADILKWMFGTIGFQTIIILGAVLALGHFGR